ncbi:MAG: energy transducer TonB [Sinobacterium sp.]|nr:energy transducer TonB [Sinobacterium sp.]
MLQHDPAAKTHDRFGFTATMAVAFHAAIILGVGFALQPPSAPSSTTMDITLSSYSTDKEVLDADFLAQTSQEASGSISTKKELTTDQLAPIDSAEINEINPDSSRQKAQEEKQSMQLVTTSTLVERKAANNNQLEKEKHSKLEGEIERIKREIELASLQAKLEKERQTYARLPRIRRASSVATQASKDAEYLYHWQQRIEAIGNQHYPHQAKELGLFGDVEVLVIVMSNGQLKSVEVTKSSGVKLLDDAALKIVRLASPFKPFPAKMRGEIDELEIPRTWQFRKDRFTRQRN